MNKDIDLYELEKLLAAVSPDIRENKNKVTEFINSSKTPEIRHARKAIMFGILYGTEDKDKSRNSP